MCWQVCVNRDRTMQHGSFREMGGVQEAGSRIWIETEKAADFSELCWGLEAAEINNSANAYSRCCLYRTSFIHIQINKTNQPSAREGRVCTVSKHDSWQCCLTLITIAWAEWVTQDLRHCLLPLHFALTTVSLHCFVDQWFHAWIWKYIICAHIPLINGLNQCQAHNSSSSGLLHQRHLVSQVAPWTLEIQGYWPL